MPQSDDERLVDLAARLERNDPRFARALATGRPARPREYRHTGAWWALAAGVAMLVTGVVVADGLLIATGLVVSGIAVQLFDSPHVQKRRRNYPDRC
ncbi:hypothetical protein SSP24_78290 [Streptomyces spinoverrucosus]|uniref:DUF3040 domain-containing protein n=1 Tax=Streptomyces spinoverrucosus TaxID=284043 RepID=A0A4Y3VT70_9ACTN|nr:DUF3040 domain-containing protein [Streptomyces spinoverrucosus]GEC10174.1 hypothetical protein SSP24_78290 [Streptomyces spinoverrucosus]GHB76489.1 hypothetical protein GCM10010397_53800 [Streptomyces spinoverrucosus]